MDSLAWSILSRKTGNTRSGNKDNEEEMTSFNSKATPSELQKMKIDEIERFIAVLRATGQDERADALEEIKPTIDGIFEDLFDLIDVDSSTVTSDLFKPFISRDKKHSE